MLSKILNCGWFLINAQNFETHETSHTFSHIFPNNLCKNKMNKICNVTVYIDISQTEQRIINLLVYCLKYILGKVA